MTVAIGYTRLSQESDTSLENQAEHIRAYTSKRGFELQEIVSDGELASGFAPDELDAYQTIRERVRSGDVDAVVTNDKRRWPRDENEVMRFVADLRDQNVQLHTHLNGQVDLSDPMDAAIEIMRASVAAEEKREEIQKAREAVQQRVEDPTVDHGRPRFGMEYNESGEVQVPGEEFETVREILELREQGLSFSEIGQRTDISRATAWRVCDRADWYRARAALAE